MSVMAQVRAELADTRIRDIATGDHPMLRWVRRDENFAGTHLLVPTSDRPGAPAFQVTRTADYERIPFSGQELALGDATMVVDRIVKSARLMGDRLSKGLFSGGVAKSFAGDSVPGISGLAEWLCAPAPYENWYAVDRTQDCIRLAGNMLSGRGVPVHEVLLEAKVKATYEGCDREAIHWLHPSMFERLLAEKPLGLSAVEHQGQRCATFEGRLFRCETIRVFAAADSDCPEHEGFLVPREAFGLASLGTAPQWLELDGANAFRRMDDDIVEVRLGMYGNTFLSPAHCARITELGQ